MSTETRMIWMDSLRLAAGISMLCLHATSDPQGQPWIQYPIEDRYAPLVLRTVLYMARTELFIIISCFLLLYAIDRRPRSYKQTVREQTQRLLIPFLFWTIFFAGFNLIKAKEFGYLAGATESLTSFPAWVGFLLLGDVKYHMHFLPTLFCIVLFYPLFKLSVKFPALGFSVVFFLVVKYELDAFVYRTFWGTEILPYLIRGIKIVSYIGYGMIAGSALGLWQKTTPEKRKEWLPAVIFFGLTLLIFKLIAAWKTAQEGEWVFTYIPAYWADFLFPVILFLLCMALSYKSWPEWISRAAPYSFGLYLCHPIFHDLYEIFVQSNSNFNPLSQIFLKIGFTMIMTTALVLILSKVKILSWTIGLGQLPKLSWRTNIKGSKV